MRWLARVATVGSSPESIGPAFRLTRNTGFSWTASTSWIDVLGNTQISGSVWDSPFALYL